MNQSNSLYSKLATLPEPTTQLFIQNQKLKRQLMILEAELSEKNKVIVQLKQQLDSSVVEQTQERLSLAREVENLVEEQVIKIRQSFYEKSLAMEDEIETLRTVVDELKKELSLSEEENQGYRSRIQSLKQYILNVVEEKDDLIDQLSTIIEQQEHEMQVAKEVTEKVLSRSNKAKKRAAIIKNQ